MCYAKRRIVCGFLVWSAACLCGIAGPNDPNDEEAVPWSPEEFRLRKELCSKTTAWLSTRNNADAAACDTVIESLLKLDRPRVSSYFAAAQAMWLRGQSKRAVEILNTVSKKHGEELAPIGAELPVKVVGQMWAATIEQQSGLAEPARKRYETILRTLSADRPTRGRRRNGDPSARAGIQGEDGLTILCRLHIAEIEAGPTPGGEVRNTAGRKRAVEQLKAAETVMGDPNQPDEGARMLRQWAIYERIKLSGNVVAARGELTDQREMMSLPMVAATQLELAGITGGPLAAGGGRSAQPDLIGETIVARVIERDVSQIHTAAARMLTAHNLEMKGHRAEAARRYNELFESESFFSPVAGINAARLKNTQGASAEAKGTLDQVGTRYPGFKRMTDGFRRTWKIDSP